MNREIGKFMSTQLIPVLICKSGKELIADFDVIRHPFQADFEKVL
jgi:hypothetical protein